MEFPAQFKTALYCRFSLRKKETVRIRITTQDLPIGDKAAPGQPVVLTRMTGFEPAASCSQSKRSTKLSHVRLSIHFLLLHCRCKRSSCCGARHLRCRQSGFLICRPQPLAPLAVSATGSARVAPQTEPRPGIYSFLII